MRIRGIFICAPQTHGLTSGFGSLPAIGHRYTVRIAAGALQGNGSMARKSTQILRGVFALAWCAAGVATAGERALVITTPVVAGAPGTTAVPDVEISYVGGERGDAFQVNLPPAPGQWRWVGTPQAIPGEFDPLCTISATGTLLVAGAGVAAGPHAGPTPICRARVAVEPGVANGSRPLPAVAPSMLECFDFTAATVPCTFSAGTLLVGERTGSASVAYTPLPGSTIALGTANTSIGVTYLPGSAGDGVVVSGCRLTGDAVVRPPRTSPPYLGFAGTIPISGSIVLACIGGLPAGNATLTCDERINDVAPQPRTWLLACPETRVPPSIDYVPPPATTIVAQGGEFAGDLATATVTVTVRNDGLGAGLPASSAVSDCSVDAPFVAELTPSPVTGEGTVGSSGAVALTCVTATAAVDRVLSCSERRGTTSVTRTWPLRCPARPSPLVFTDGFETVASP